MPLREMSELMRDHGLGGRGVQQAQQRQAQHQHAPGAAQRDAAMLFQRAGVEVPLEHDPMHPRRADGVRHRVDARMQGVMMPARALTERGIEATIRAYGLPIVSTEEVRRTGAAAAAQRCLDHLADCDLIYVSFDVDSLDGTLFKGTGTPVAGGMWCHEALELNRTLLRDPRVCCWEICEINPHLDVLNALAEASLGIFQGVLEELEQRL